MIVRYFVLTALIGFLATSLYSQELPQQLEQQIQEADKIYSKGIESQNALDKYEAINKILIGRQLKNARTLHVKLRLVRLYISLSLVEKATKENAELHAISEELSSDYYKVASIVDNTFIAVLNRNFDKAVMYYESAVGLLEKEDFPDLELRAQMAIGFASIVNEDTDNAIKHYERALSMAIEQCDYSRQHSIYGNLAHAYMNKGNHRKAILACKKAVRLSRIQNFKPTYVLSSNQGHGYKNLRQYDSAMFYFEKAHQEALDNENRLSIATTINNIASLYYTQGDYSDGIVQYLKGYEVAKSIKNYPILKEVSKSLSQGYAVQENYEKAYYYIQKHQEYKEFLDNQTSEKKLEEFQTKYETREKEERIQLLDRENALKATIIERETERKRSLWIMFGFVTIVVVLLMWGWHRMTENKLLVTQQNLRYRGMMEAEQAERKRIAQDLHDSLGQSISAVKMQTSLLATSSRDSERYDVLLSQIDRTYDELRDISHNIMPNTLIRLGLIPAVRELITEMNVDQQLTIRMDADEKLQGLNEDQIINIYRIIQEILANCIKHAQATIINVKLKAKEKGTLLTISDNGRGMNTELLKNTNGIGWKNIVSRVSLLSGKVVVKSNYGEGTSITIRLP